MIDQLLLLEWAVYGVPTVMLLAGFHFYARFVSTRNQRVLESAIDAGLTQPASLHPVINPSICLGCATCAGACPEAIKNPVIGIIEQRAFLIEPTNCIGHGACKNACPTGAIQLVFGTATRGIEIPNLSSNYESSVQGLFIAGELGGMGLIKNAVMQGIAAIDAISERMSHPNSSNPDYELIIVGAGPAGFAASLRAKELGIRTLTVEQDSLGGTVYQFPRGKLVMTSPVELPLFGSVNFSNISKESLLEFWRDVARQHNPNIEYQTAVTGIKSNNNQFLVSTSAGLFKSRFVLLAIGRRGTPRKLDVPGESLPKVTYRLIDPEQYQKQRVLIAGGGDSALEAALALSSQPGTQVDLAYRGDAFSRAKRKNRELIEKYSEEQRINIHFKSTVDEISKKAVRLKTPTGLIDLHNDAVIINAGGILPTQFLERIGVQYETKFGTV